MLLYVRNKILRKCEVEVMGNVSRMGVYEIGAIFEHMDFVFREQPIEDYGIDAIIEERTSESLSGKLIGVQIKSGSSYFREKKNDCVVFRGEQKHYDYWKNYSIPVIIVLYNPDDALCIFDVFDTQRVELTSKGWKMEINKNKELKNGKDILRNLTKNQTEYYQRLTALVFSKPLIEMAKQRKLIIEVNEWVNKSSGKGDFRIKTTDGQVIYDRPIWGFGLKPYEQVLTEMFPWAELNVDRTYYEQFGDPVYMKSFHGTIYPYCNVVGEVDKYRLIPEINDVGNAFLIMDSFLNFGKMYKIRFR